jgi:hypothetical protein
VEKPYSLPTTECIELTALTVSRSCPVSFNTLRALSFSVRAVTSATALEWRRAATSNDVLTPSSGTISSSGTTVVAATQTVLDQNVTFEVVDGSRVLLRFTLDNY